jgi:flagella basal body P-ring formation protein FlgA
VIRLAVIALFVTAQVVAADTLTAARLVRANSVISAADLAVSDAEIPGALAPDADILGLEARVTLYPGHPIRPQDVGPAALIERNQQIVLVYRTGGLTILAEARSLSRGAVGDTIRAMNLSSRTTVFGRVEPDGTVSVSF